MGSVSFICLCSISLSTVFYGAVWVHFADDLGALFDNCSVDLYLNCFDLLAFSCFGFGVAGHFADGFVFRSDLGFGSLRGLGQVGYEVGALESW